MPFPDIGPTSGITHITIFIIIHVFTTERKPSFFIPKYSPVFHKYLSESATNLLSSFKQSLQINTIIPLPSH